MHVHSKQPLLPQPMAPRAEKAQPARQDAVAALRVSDALSGGSGRRGGSPSRDAQGRTKPDAPDEHHDPAGLFAAKLAVLSFAALDGETVGMPLDETPASPSPEAEPDFGDLLMRAVPDADAPA